MWENLVFRYVKFYDFSLFDCFVLWYKIGILELEFVKIQLS